MSKIDGESRSFLHHASPNIYYDYGINNIPPNYIYVNGDTVFYLTSDGFRVLLNFNAQIGDTWDISYEDDNDSTTQDTTRVIVVDEGWENGGRYIELDMVTCSHYIYAGVFHERFGLLRTDTYWETRLFPVNDNGCLGGTYCGGQPFICSYSDVSFQLNSNSKEYCKLDYLNILGFTDDLPKRFSVFPNPTTDMIQIRGENLTNRNLFIYDVSGREVFSKKLSNDQQTLQIGDFEKGVYLIKIEESGIEEKLIIK